MTMGLGLACRYLLLSYTRTLFFIYCFPFHVYRNEVSEHAINQSHLVGNVFISVDGRTSGEVRPHSLGLTLHDPSLYLPSLHFASSSLLFFLSPSSLFPIILIHPLKMIVHYLVTVWLLYRLMASGLFGMAAIFVLLLMVSLFCGSGLCY